MTDRTKQRINDFEIWAHWIFRVLIALIAWIGLEINNDIKELKANAIIKGERDAALTQQVQGHERRITNLEGDVKAYHSRR